MNKDGTTFLTIIENVYSGKVDSNAGYALYQKEFDDDTCSLGANGSGQGIDNLGIAITFTCSHAVNIFGEPKLDNLCTSYSGRNADEVIYYKCDEYVSVMALGLNNTGTMSSDGYK